MVLGQYLTRCGIIDYNQRIMNLIIVESPTKSKTITKFLGQDYKVLSSFGHIRDLPISTLGVDVENNFTPKYIIPQKARKVIKELKAAAKESDNVILATDEDREGEAIAWHLSEALELKDPQRIVFHEITKTAIQEALKNPRKIDQNLVDAQQARRILDRIVGYKLSPFLWKKVARGLSAGRVQSVAVKLVADREREIEKFKAEEYWSIEALFEKAKKEFSAFIIKKNDEVFPKLGIKDKKEADKIVKDLDRAECIIEKIERRETKKNPLPPFKTSTLQQEAWKRFRFPAKFTMRIAQQLYEKGYITYHRTDSLNLSNLSLGVAKRYIESKYGKEYYSFRKYKSKDNAQDAHEAIRPAYPDKEPEKIRLDKNQQALYDIIWRRFIACQMKEAIFNSTSIDIKAKEYTLRLNGQMLRFDGFLKVYPIKFEENDLPELKEKESLNLKELIPAQHFTQPPARYTEASLIKVLEENGIGRPSTYAPIITTIQNRNYIEKNEQKRFQPTEIGLVVNDILAEHFPKIVDIKFTANMEKDLDKIAEGEEKWTKISENFYTPFNENLQEKYKEVEKKEASIEKTDRKCPKCNSPLVIRLGRFGKFYACSGFPECRHTEPLEKKTLGIKCPRCKEGELTEKRTKRKKIFYGCDKFPDCDFALWDKPLHGRQAGTGEKCKKCGSLLIETKRKQIKCSNKDCNS